MSLPRPGSNPKPRILVLAGTRPECLKLSSLVQAIEQDGRVEVVLANSGQHPDMVLRSFAQFGIAPRLNLAAVPARSSLSSTVRHLRDTAINAMRAVKPAMVIVQGDTSTAYAGALAARAGGVALAHVEAGLRTDHPYRPFPEELFRRRIAPLADWHFAPTARARANLLAEGIPAARIHQVGNTGIDLLRSVIEGMATAADETPAWRERFTRLLTLTLHRRENYGRRLDLVCEAILSLLGTHPELGVVCPLHPNPAVANRLRRLLGKHSRVVLTESMPYRPFVSLLAQSTLIVTDSGGIQEEAPYLGVPVLVARDNTERPESGECGTTRLVAIESHAIVAAADELLRGPRPRKLAFDQHAPYGDGRSGARIAGLLADHLAAIDARAAALA